MLDLGLDMQVVTEETRCESDTLTSPRGGAHFISSMIADVFGSEKPTPQLSVKELKIVMSKVSSLSNLLLPHFIVPINDLQVSKLGKCQEMRSCSAHPVSEAGRSRARSGRSD